MKGLNTNDIVLVDFGIREGSEQGKVRPALVIQNMFGNTFGTTTIVVPITSNVSKSMPTHVMLPADTSYYMEDHNTGLSEDSYVLCEQVETISMDKIIRMGVGKINKEQRAKIDKALKVAMDIA